MLVAKKEVSKGIDILNKKPMIRKNQSTGEMIPKIIIILHVATKLIYVLISIVDYRFHK